MDPALALVHRLQTAEALGAPASAPMDNMAADYIIGAPATPPPGGGAARTIAAPATLVKPLAPLAGEAFLPFELQDAAVHVGGVVAAESAATTEPEPEPVVAVMEPLAPERVVAASPEAEAVATAPALGVQESVPAPPAPGAPAPEPQAEPAPAPEPKPVAVVPVEATKEESTAAPVTCAEWLAQNRLAKFAECFEQIGCLSISDLRDVMSEDLAEMGMPALQQRRFLAASAKIPAPELPPRARGQAAELLAKVDALSNLPNGASDAYDPSVLADAADQVANAAASMTLSVLDPWQWLEDYGLSLFKVNFEGLGVREIVDFTEVLDQDLMAMAMPLLQFRRFREHAADIPPAGGSSYRLDLYAADIAAQAGYEHMVPTWLECLRLKHFQEKFLSIGVRDLKDFREVREDDLVAMGMPLLQRRRFLMSAGVCVANLPESPEHALATMQHKAAMCNTPPQWLDALNLTLWFPSFDSLGILDVLDFKEVLRSDLEEMELPLLQLRRFLAAVAVIPEAPELPGRRWETPSKWLESLRLKRFESFFLKMGVDRVVDFAEVLDTDLIEIGMSPLQRRRFRGAVAVDAQPTLEAGPFRGAGVDADPATNSMSTMRGMRAEDLLNLTPIRWLGLIRCENFITDFEDLGVEMPVDFAEVTEDDLAAMGLPLLQKRRFAQAAVQVEELHLFHKERNAAAMEQPDLNDPFQWLKQLRLAMFVEALYGLGVEEVSDFTEVMEEDLHHMGMKALQRRRFAFAAQDLAAGL